MNNNSQSQKKGKNFLKCNVLILFLMVVFTMTSCKQDKQEDPKEAANEQNEAKFEDNNKKENDAEFLVAAAAINLEEIELGKLAQNNAQSQEVKEFGKMMIDGHTKSLNELTALASSKQITVPQQVTEDANESYKDLTDEKGNDFDKKYMSKMVKGHKDAIDKFESAQKDTQDADIQAWINKTLPDLNAHLNHAKTLEDKIK